MFQTCFSTVFITLVWTVIEYLVSILLAKLGEQEKKRLTYKGVGIQEKLFRAAAVEQDKLCENQGHL